MAAERLDLKPIAPRMLSPIVSRFQSQILEERHISGEDVQEFSLFVLDNLEKELIQLKQMYGNVQSGGCGTADYGEEDDWMVVGKKNKVAYQRTTGVVDSSMISSIFGGLIHSEVKASGMVPSITTHSFITLILDIVPDYVQTLEDALDLYTSKDLIPGSNRTTMATKSNLFKKLPKYLVICLKQYTYTPYGMEKIQKRIRLDQTLMFERRWMVRGNQHSYRLCATCNHHGTGRGGDHYTANVMDRNGYWSHFNDSACSRTNVESVLFETPYLLMYERM